MMIANSRFLALCALPLLSACGGATTNGPASFDEVLGAAASFDAQVAADAAGAAQLTAAAQLPSTGTARFAGVMSVASSPETALSDGAFIGMAETAMTLDFGAGTVTGTTDQFFEVDLTSATTENALPEGTAIDGRLTYSMAAPVDGVNFFEGATVGSLTTTAGNTIAIDAELRGGVTGSTGQTFRAVTLEESADYTINVMTLRQ